MQTALQSGVDRASAMPLNGATAPSQSPRRHPSDEDFIAHPPQFPLRFRRRSLPLWRAPAVPDSGGDVGLSFHSNKYLPAGTRIELEIPLRGTTQRFSATVVLVREQADGYQIGLWFASLDDASRARIVEKICRTECYLRSRQAPPN